MSYFKNAVCPVCRELLNEQDDVVVCPECGAPYHRACYKEAGRCLYEDKHGTGFSYLPDPEPEQKEEPIIQTSIEEEKFEDFDTLERSPVLNEMPKASSLFKAIINKSEDLNSEAQLENILSSNENVFTAKSSIRTIEEEPELFPDHNPTPFARRKQEEPEELIVNDDEEYTPTLIERVTGFSIARRNRKKKEQEHIQEAVTPSFSDDEYHTEDRLNLEIPSFLRRK